MLLRVVTVQPLVLVSQPLVELATPWVATALLLVVLLVQAHHLKVITEELVLEVVLHLLMVLVVAEVLEL